MTLCARLVPGCVVLLCVVALSFPLHSSAQSATSTPADVETRRQQLFSLFDEKWQYTLRTNPEWATMLGDSRYKDRLGDYSPEFFQIDLEQKHKFLTRFEAVDPAGFSTQDTLSRELMIRELRQDIEGAKFRHWEMPVNQMGGLHLELPDLIVLTPFKTVSDFDNYLARLHQIPHAFDQVIANMRQGLHDGLMPPCYLLEKVATEADDIASKAGERSPVDKPATKSSPLVCPDPSRSGYARLFSWRLRTKSCPPTNASPVSFAPNTLRTVAPTPESGRFRTEQPAIASRSAASPLPK